MPRIKAVYLKILVVEPLCGSLRMEDISIIAIQGVAIWKTQYK